VINEIAQRDLGSDFEWISTSEKTSPIDRSERQSRNEIELVMNDGAFSKNNRLDDSLAEALKSQQTYTRDPEPATRDLKGTADPEAIDYVLSLLYDA
jgi:hypothetical protein